MSSQRPNHQQPRPAPPVGRALRVLLGVALIVHVVPTYLQLAVPRAVVASLLVLGLIGVYGLIHVVVARRIIAFGPGLGVALGVGLLVALYLAGAPGSPIFGGGEGELAAVTFLGLSLVVAGVRADPGCEVLAIPGALFGKHTELACFVFSPLDRLEHRLRSKRAV